MVTEPGKKIRADHLQRNAYLYVRQSSVRQLYEHAESTKRQYALADRAVALGWPRANIITIDSDLGQSGSSVANRDGFKKLVAEVTISQRRPSVERISTDTRRGAPGSGPEASMYQVFPSRVFGRQ
jgi:hypothetical protein